MKRLTLAVIWIAFAAMAASPIFAGEQVQDRVPELYATFPDLAGRVFEPGDEVEIHWVLSGSGVRYYESNVWGECELLFTGDGGKTWSRITPQLSISRRSYSWVVPEMPTREAQIGLMIGIEGDGEFHQFASKRFTIRALKPIGEVELAPKSTEPLRGGSTLEIEWSAPVTGLQKFEVLVSSDRGAHFFSVGETTESRFAYAIPADYEGFLTVQVVAHRHGNPPLRSAVDDRSTFRVQAAEIAAR